MQFLLYDKGTRIIFYYINLPEILRKQKNVKSGLQISFSCYRQTLPNVKKTNPTPGKASGLKKNRYKKFISKLKEK